MALMLAACNQKTADGEDIVYPTASNMTSEIMDTVEDAIENEVGMANPMVAVTSSKEFQDLLGISLDPSLLSDDAELYVISDKIAEVDYSIPGMEDGETVDVTMRASKDESDISGVYGAVEEAALEYNDMTIAHKSLDEENIEVYEFSNGDVNYSLEIKGQASQMLIGELLDSALLSAGIPLN